MTDELEALIGSFALALQAANKAPTTIRLYTRTVRHFAAFLAGHGLPVVVGALTPAHVEQYMAAQVAAHAPASAASRYAWLHVWFRWLVDEGILPASPMARMHTPHIPEAPPPVFSERELRALVAACAGTGFVARRDLALVRVLLDTGMRLSECAGLTLDALDWELLGAVVRGKGRRVRMCPFGKKTAVALDRYVRVRRTHRAADLPHLWLGQRGAMGAGGIYDVIVRRARAAGLKSAFPHRFRHSFAHTWLALGGQEGDLMRLAGWRSRQMLAKYGASAADARARDAYARLQPGDRI